MLTKELGKLNKWTQEVIQSDPHQAPAKAPKGYYVHVTYVYIHFYDLCTYGDIFLLEIMPSPTACWRFVLKKGKHFQGSHFCQNCSWLLFVKGVYTTRKEFTPFCAKSKQKVSKLSKRMTKHIIRPVRPTKIRVSLRICVFWSVSSLIACAFYSLQAIQRRDEREPLPYWMDLQTDLSLCQSHRSYLFCRALTHLSLL